MGPTEFSAYRDYPKRYKFIGVQFFMSQDREHIYRRMSGLVDIGSAAGGLFTFCRYGLLFLVGWVAEAKLNFSIYK